MSPTIVQAFEKQADHERLASATYLALSHWCECEHYSGFAEFFKKQSAEETAHAAKFYKHLLDRGITPKLGPLPAPDAHFKDLLDVAQLALELERANSFGIHAAYEISVEEKDYPSQVFLYSFIAEQVEEEAWADKMVAKVRAASCAGALTYLDRHIVKLLTEE